MKDGRLTRTYIAIRRKRLDYQPRHSRGIAMIPLGNRNRVLLSLHNAEERDSLGQYDKYLKEVS